MIFKKNEEIDPSTRLGYNRCHTSQSAWLEQPEKDELTKVKYLELLCEVSECLKKKYSSQ
jgi:hypothetical protein